MDLWFFDIPSTIMQIEFFENELLIRMPDKGVIEILPSDSEERKSISNTAILGERDQIFIKAENVWIFPYQNRKSHL